MSTGYIKDGRYMKTAGNAFSDYERHIQYGKEYWTGQYAPDGSNDKLYEMWLRGESNTHEAKDIEIGELPDDLGSVHSIEGSTYIIDEDSNETWWPFGGYWPQENNSFTANVGWHSTVFVRRNHSSDNGKIKVYFRISFGNDVNSHVERKFRPRVRILYTRKAQSQEGEE